MKAGPLEGSIWEMELLKFKDKLDLSLVPSCAERGPTDHCGLVIEPVKWCSLGVGKTSGSRPQGAALRYLWVSLEAERQDLHGFAGESSGRNSS